MAKEVLLYFPIYASTAANFINEMEANKGNDVCVRMNCPGGDVMSAMGMIAKYNEHKAGKSVKVDGRAASMGAYICAMSDDVECLDTSEFLIHRAAFPSWVENDKSIFTDDLKAMLSRHNSVLRASLENKFTSDKFKSITGKSLDDVFSMDSRIDVTLTASQAKDLGLISRIVPLNQSKKKEINALASGIGIAAFYDEAGTINVQTQNHNKMTVAEIKANAEVFNALKAEVLAEEKDRIAAFAEFKEIDPTAVLDAIVKGDKFTNAFGAKMTVAAMKNNGKQNMATATATTTESAEQTTATTEDAAAATAVNDFFKNVNANALSAFGVTATA